MNRRRLLTGAGALAAYKTLPEWTHGQAPAPSGPTVNVTYDDSWDTFAHLVSGLHYDSPSPGTVNTPNIGFVDQPTMDASTAVVNQFIADFKTLCGSTGTINVRFGFGRTLDPNNGLYSIASGGFSANNASFVSTITYPQYVTLVGGMNSTQKACWPLPGSFTVGAGTISITSCFSALTQNTTDANFFSIMLVPPGAPGNAANWDTNTNTTVCAGGRLKMYASLWHEFTQTGLMRIFHTSPYFISTQMAFTSPGVPATLFSSPCYWAIDTTGTTSLGTTSMTAFDPGDWTVIPDTQNAFAEGAVTGSARIPLSSPMIIPGGNTLPLRAPEDAKLLCALMPPSAILKTLAGL